MKQVVKLSGFILITISTLGLLVSVFTFDWGIPITLTFASVNVVGLATLAFAHWSMKKDI